MEVMFCYFKRKYKNVIHINIKHCEKQSKSLNNNVFQSEMLLKFIESNLIQHKRLIIFKS